MAPIPRTSAPIAGRWHCSVEGRRVGLIAEITNPGYPVSTKKFRQNRLFSRPLRRNFRSFRRLYSAAESVSNGYHPGATDGFAVMFAGYVC